MKTQETKYHCMILLSGLKQNFSKLLKSSPSRECQSIKRIPMDQPTWLSSFQKKTTFFYFFFYLVKKSDRWHLNLNMFRNWYFESSTWKKINQVFVWFSAFCRTSKMIAGNTSKSLYRLTMKNCKLFLYVL